MTELLNEDSVRLTAGQLIQQEVVSLARASVDCQLVAHPESREYFTGDFPLRCAEDTERVLTALAQALLSGEPWLFESYVIWDKIVLSSLGLRDAYLHDSLTAMRETLVARLGSRPARPAAEYIDAAGVLLDAASEELPSTPHVIAPLAGVAVVYLDALLAGDRARALAVIRLAVSDGAVLPDIYEHVFRVAQAKVGCLWQSNRLSVAMEHYTTGATEAIMSQMNVVKAGLPGTARFLGACVEGDQHDLAIRMVCDILQADGWETVLLGANTPDHVLFEAIEEFHPDVVGLSATWLFRIDNVRRVIAHIHDTYRGVKVVVGGAPFDRITGLADKVGADARGGSLLALPTLLHRLVATN